MTDLIAYTPSAKLAEEFPEFTQITIYGDQENPLFPLGQVQEFLGTGQIRLDRGDYALGVDYIKALCNRKDGRADEQNLLTEEGLYHVLFRTKTPVSRKFRHFTKIVMKELRLRGQVTLDSALEKLKWEIEDRDQKITDLNQQLDEEHNKRIQFQRSSEKFYMQKMDAISRAAAAEMKLKQAQDVADTSPEYLFEHMKARFLKRVYVYLVKPPKAIEDEFPTFEDGDPTDDEEICFEVSFRARDQPTCAEFYMMKDVKMETFHTELHARNFTVMTNDKIHASKFRGSIDEIRDLVDHMLAKALQ
jgi:prophage antirepressor-like protein